MLGGDQFLKVELSGRISEPIPYERFFSTLKYFDGVQMPNLPFKMGKISNQSKMVEIRYQNQPKDSLTWFNLEKCIWSENPFATTLHTAHNSGKRRFLVKNLILEASRFEFVFIASHKRRTLSAFHVLRASCLINIHMDGAPGGKPLGASCT